MSIQEKKLSNGLSVIMAPIEGTRAVASLFLIGWGAAQEKETMLGAAHFLEHMMFKGTRSRPSKRAISEELDAMGAKFNAFTAHEMTGYYIKAAEQHHERAMDILSDMILRSLLRAEDVESERGVIIEEMRMNRDVPMHHVSDLFFDLTFDGHPMQRNIIGTEESISAMQQEDLVSFFQEGYRADNAALVVAGALDVEKTMQWAEQYFGGLSSGGGVESKAFVPKQKEPRIIIEKRAIDQAHLWLGFSGVALNDDRRFAVGLLGVLLGGNMSSRLFMEIRENRGLAYYVASSHEEGRDYGLFFTRAGVEMTKLSEAVEAIVAEHRKLKEDPISLNELQRAKDYTKGSMALSLEESNDLAMFLMEQKVLGGDFLTIEEVSGKIDSVTIEDVQSMAQELFSSEHINLAVITQEAEKEGLRSILEKV